MRSRGGDQDASMVAMRRRTTLTALLTVIAGVLCACGSSKASGDGPRIVSESPFATLEECNTVTEAELIDAVGPLDGVTFKSATSYDIDLRGYALIAAQFDKGRARWIASTYHSGTKAVAVDKFAAEISGLPSRSDDPSLNAFLADKSNRVALVPCAFLTGR